MTKIFRRL